MAHDHGEHGHDMGDMDMDMEVFCLGNGTVMLNGFQVAIGGEHRNAGSRAKIIKPFKPHLRG